MTYDLPKSAVSGVAWPALVSHEGGMLMGLQYQFDHTQWLPPEELRRMQYRQLGAVIHHADETVPFYRRRFEAAGLDPRAALDDEAWARLPPLTRRDIQDAGADLHSTAPPRAHGQIRTISTSGSTGTPVTTLATRLTHLYWLALTWRDQVWHGFELSGKLAAIRRVRPGRGDYPDGTVGRNWGPAMRPNYDTGPVELLSIATPVAQQVEWLRRRDPDYLITYPSNLMALLTHCREHGVRLGNLKHVETISETLHPHVREACREIWGLRIVDMYSTQELGYIALQCPEHEHYHVQSENVLVEVVDDDGRPCGPGETGRMVVTSLHNFAMPMLRYDLGDYAEVGAPCPCGRGLPVLSRILGRVRNMLRLPTGEARWPSIEVSKLARLAPVRQCQVVQTALETVEVRLVAERALTEEEESGIEAHLRERFGYPFAVRFAYLDEIPRSKSGKFEDFRSEIGS